MNDKPWLSRARSRKAPRKAARLLRSEPAKAPLAREPRPLRGLGERGDAPADARRNGAPLLRAVDASLPRRRSARARPRSGRAARLAGARLLLARAATAGGGAGDRGTARRTAAERSGAFAGAARSGRLFGGSDREHRLRTARADRGRQRGARPDAPFRAHG